MSSNYFEEGVLKGAIYWCCHYSCYHYLKLIYTWKDKNKNGIIEGINNQSEWSANNDDVGQTPLMSWVKRSFREDLLQLLLDFGRIVYKDDKTGKEVKCMVDVTLRDNKKRTIFDICKALKVWLTMSVYPLLLLNK